MLVVSLNPEAGIYWKTNYLFFDQYTLSKIQPDHIWGEFDNADGADKLMRLNYDIHT